MVDSRLVLGVHGLVAVGLFVLGIVRISAGSAVGGTVNVVMAVLVFVLGVYIIRR